MTQTTKDKSAQQEMGSVLPSGNTAREGRRALLKLAATGMPMVLTMKASASGPLISQLQCFYKLGVRQRILVDDTGAAWVGTERIRYRSGRGFKESDIVAFKATSTAFSAGAAPSQFRPLACSGNAQQQSGWIDCGYNFYSIGANATITPADYLNGSTWNPGTTKKGLYLELTRQLALSPASGNGWPGISCVNSILIYLGQN